jgi:hypothetical protein
MAISNGFWPLDLSVESLVLREIVPTIALNKGRQRLFLETDVYLADGH